MTKREFLQAIADGQMTEEVKAYAQEELKTVIASDAKREQARAEKDIADQPFYDAMIAHVEKNGATLTSDFAKVLGVSTQKASALARRLVDRGFFFAETVSVKGKGKQKQYSAYAEPIEEEEQADGLEEILEEVTE